jgi:hypothetical protein
MRRFATNCVRNLTFGTPRTGETGNFRVADKLRVARRSNVDWSYGSSCR